MDKINFKWFKATGRKLAIGDCVIACDGFPEVVTSADIDSWNNEKDDDHKCWITSFCAGHAVFYSFAALLEEYNFETATSVQAEAKPALTETMSDEISNFKITHESPVYTKAMADAGELPPVGCDFMMKHKRAGATWAQPDFHKAKMKAIGDELFIVESGSTCNGNRESVGGLNDYLFKPIDTRTPREKLIDEIVDCLDQSQNVSSKDLAGQIIDICGKDL